MCPLTGHNHQAVPRRILGTAWCRVLSLMHYSCYSLASNYYFIVDQVDHNAQKNEELKDITLKNKKAIN